MNSYFHGHPIVGERGPAGPDGNPIGTIISIMGKSVPDGYLRCDGATYKQDDYPDLVKFFEEEFGEKNPCDGFGRDAEDEFRVPDISRRFLLGVDPSAEEINYKTIGITGGQEKVMLTGTELPSHTHVVTGIGGSKATIATSTSDYNGGSIKFLAGVNGSQTVSYVQSYGESKSHQNMPPYMVVTFCIKAIAPKGDSMPSGSVIIWSGPADEIPEGWALCDGKNGTPDLRSNFVWGYNPEKDESWPVGETGGAEKVALVTNEVPNHSHVLDIMYGAKSTISTSSSGSKYALIGDGGTTTVGTGLIRNVSGTTSTPHNNMPPFMVLCYIMKL